MSGEVLTAILSCAGTLIGTFGGILASNKLTRFRLQALEEKVNAHNNLVARMKGAETNIADIDKRVTTNTQNITTLLKKG